MFIDQGADALQIVRLDLARRQCVIDECGKLAVEELPENAADGPICSNIVSVSL
jgi:hypothetical protein